MTRIVLQSMNGMLLQGNLQEKLQLNRTGNEYWHSCTDLRRFVEQLDISIYIYIYNSNI